MSRELDLLAKQYAKGDVTVLRKDIKLYGKNLMTEMTPFNKEVERQCRKDKSGVVTVIAILSE